MEFAEEASHSGSSDDILAPTSWTDFKICDASDPDVMEDIIYSSKSSAFILLGLTTIGWKKRKS
jgi:hypothetical protein